MCKCTTAPPTAQFANVFTPVANLTTIPVDVSYAVQGEVILKFAYTHCNFQWDLGYDFWGRSCAKICKRCDCCDNGFQDNVWGLKGDAFVFGFPGDFGLVPTCHCKTTCHTIISDRKRSDNILLGTNNLRLSN